MRTATRLPIPRILGIGWWWLILPYVLEWPISVAFHIPDWIPPFAALWLLSQIIWLKIAEPRSRTLYWAIAGWGLYVILGKLPGRNDALTVSFVVVFFAVVLVFLDVFRNELQAHFNVTDPIGLDLGGWRRLPWMFALNAFYFQFHFHRLYKKQQKIYRSLTPEA